MPKYDRNQFRIAYYIRAQLDTLETDRLSELIAHSDRASDLIERFQRIERQLRICHNKALRGAASRLRQRAVRLLVDLRLALDALGRECDGHTVALPSVGDIFRDLEQLEDEFAQWQYEPSDKALIVTTEPIELEGTYLGPFEIRLCLRELAQLGRRDPYAICALDPNSAAGSDHVTHPHVSDEHLCAGDASAAILGALQHGRISDFFLLVRSVLTTYNPGSPFVSLDQWNGDPCADCGYRMHEDNRFWCEQCEQDYCDDCVSGCRGCDLTLCRGCVTECNFCEEPVCQECLVKCTNCEALCCKSCLDEDRCPKCVEDMENQDEQPNDNEKKQVRGERASVEPEAA